MTAPTRPVLRYHGGKWMLAPWILTFFPPHRIYTEAYGGAGSVLMRKRRAPFLEVWNDLDGELVGLFRVLRDPARAALLREQLALTPFSRDEFALSYQWSDDPVEQARRTVVRSFMGFGSDSASGARTGFRAKGNRQSCHPTRDWQNYPEALRLVTERLLGVELEHRDALDVIRQHDEPRTLHYVDPPYPHTTRSRASVRTGKGYRHEMTEENHRALAGVLRSTRGMVVLSGYACDLYDLELYPDWQRDERDTHADGGLDRVEVVWRNEAAVRALEGERRQHDFALQLTPGTPMEAPANA